VAPQCRNEGLSMPEPTSVDQMSVEDYLELAGAALQQSRPDDALVALHAAELLDPEEPAVHLGLGGIYLHNRKFADAVASLQRAVALDPDIALAHYNLGLALLHLNRDEAATTALQRAVALDAGLADAHGRLGDVLLKRGRRHEAIDSFRRAAEAVPNTSLGRLSHAKTLMAEHRPTEAEACLREAVARDPGNWLTHWTLGSLLSETGRFGAAIECFDRTIALEPHYVGAYVSLISTRRVSDDDRTLIDRAIQCLHRDDLTEHERAALNFALGKAFDDLRDYATAMRYVDAGNRLRRGAGGADRTVVRGRVDRLIGRCSADFLIRHARHLNDETPVLILGMPRSGTTLVEQIISSHPLVGAGGELGFWATAGAQWGIRGMPELGESEAARLAAEYRALLQSIAPTAAKVTDKLPYNFEWIGLILAVFPRARIIHCRRNPIDTCLSIYCTPFVSHRGYESDRGDLAFYFQQYLRLMAHWRSVVPPEQFLEIDYETVVAEREAATRRLITFCGLEWDAACLRHEANPNTVRTASMWQARQPVYRTSVERWRNYEPWLGELRELLPSSG
jgi:tetratricopeptide (TPR) repeat protein